MQITEVQSMNAHILDGKTLARNMQLQLQQRISEYNVTNSRTPGLAVILVGADPASQFYIKNKQTACKRVGIHSELHRLSNDATQQDIADLIITLNNDNNIDGILLQLPLPKHIDPDPLLYLIDAGKDVDGFHPYNLGRLLQRQPTLRPCTPYGIIKLLQHYDIPLRGKHAVIVGASNIVGRPLACELLLAKSTVTVCHRFTKDLEKQIKHADILISATGKTDIILSKWIQPGAVVVDVGFSRATNGTIRGDIDFKSAEKVASWITPVPGGVGPMTVTMLLENTWQAFLNHTISSC